MMSVIKRREHGITTVIVAWTAPTTADESEWIELNGVLDRIETRPAFGAPPTVNYDITLENVTNFDLLASQALNRSATVAQRVDPYTNLGAADHVDIVLQGQYELRIANHGGGNAGGVVALVLVDLPNSQQPPSPLPAAVSA